MRNRELILAEPLEHSVLDAASSWHLKPDDAYSGITVTLVFRPCEGSPYHNLSAVRIDRGTYGEQERREAHAHDRSIEREEGA